MCLAGVVVSFAHYSYVFGRCRGEFCSLVMCLAGVVVSVVHYSYVFGRCRGEFCSL